MGKTVGKTGKVYSFEPVPFTYQTLCVVGKLLGFGNHVKLIENGCGNENGKIKFTVPVQDSGAFATGQAYIGGRNDDRSGKESQVRWASTKDVEADIIKLDDFLPEIEDLPLVKADIEGAEFFAFQGAEKLFNKHLPTTICEINPWFLEGFGINLDELLDFFFSKGYKIFHYTNNNGKFLREVSGNDIVEDNYVFIHPNRFDRFAEFMK
jgi:FkbM family methyltransferase